MTDRELLAKLEGFLAANLDRGLSPAQIEQALKMLREATVPYLPMTPTYPSYPDDGGITPAPYWTPPFWSNDKTAPL